MKLTMYLAALLIALFPIAAHGTDYVIGEGDVLYVSVWGEEALSLSVKVRPDGMITIPAVGDVPAAGVVPGELQKQLTSKLRGIIKEPVVTVIVEQISNNKVYVFGGGIKAGVYNLDRKTTLLQILCQVEDTEDADLQNAYVLRKGKKIKEGFHQLFVKGNISDDLVIEPDDTIFIPSNVQAVYVMGAVKQPTFVRYRDGMTVMEAILGAGGFTEVAKKNATVIFRRNGEKETSINVKLNNLVKDGKIDQNVKLMPGDYVFVGESFF